MKPRKYLYMCISNGGEPFFLRTDNKPFDAIDRSHGFKRYVKLIYGKSGNKYEVVGRMTRKAYNEYRQEQIDAFGESYDEIEEC